MSSCKLAVSYQPTEMPTHSHRVAPHRRRRAFALASGQNICPLVSFATLTLAAGLSGSPSEAATPPGVGPFKMRTIFTGADRCLDIINDGINDKPTMAACGNYSGQMWYVEPIETGQFKLHTEFTGADRCLGIINDGTKNRLIVAACANYSSQAWSFQPTGDGHDKLKTPFTGLGKCLDIINDGTNDKPVMAACGNFSGQFWSVEK